MPYPYTLTTHKDPDGTPVNIVVKVTDNEGNPLPDFVIDDIEGATEETIKQAALDHVVTHEKAPALLAEQEQKKQELIAHADAIEAAHAEEKVITDAEVDAALNPPAEEPVEEEPTIEEGLEDQLNQP